MQYQVVIGLEIHLQAKTKSKMFCRCDANYFGSPANSHVCPVCMGLPGALPVPNAKALEQCIKLALALDCQINQHSKFDRKNYFYPDLPKGYQISQYDLPIGHGGFLEIDIEGDSRRIRITRVHMEEDTAKSLHGETDTLIDFNKSGIPLIEIVTEPDFESVAEVLKFAKRLKQTVQYLGISDADMEKGQMRFELNLSLRKVGESGLPNYKVEVKNISSISVLEKVINFEVARQSALLDAGETPQQETRGLKDMSGETVSQRVKEGAADYRYFPEPDIPLLDFSDDYISQIKSQIVELPGAAKLRYLEVYKLEPDTAETIIHSRSRVEWFDQLIEIVNSRQSDPTVRLKLIKEAAKWFIGDLFRLKQLSKIPFSKLPVTQLDLVEIAERLDARTISGTIAKQVLEQLFKSGGNAGEIIESQNMTLISDASQITTVAQSVIDANAKVVADYAKNPNAIKFLVGQVMKQMRGKASPQVAEEALRKLLDS
jgi:aspartyl-tRNA(Asn)/glutamyl-tRNA(Gln) amidotransferase subunit B